MAEVKNESKAPAEVGGDGGSPIAKSLKSLAEISRGSGGGTIAKSLKSLVAEAEIYPPLKRGGLLPPPPLSRAATKRKPVLLGDTEVVTGGSTRSWARSHGEFIAGQAHIDKADRMAVAMEAKWGAGRVRMLVGPELRTKFDRQRYLLNQAIWHGQLEDVRREAARMCAAWRAVDKAATDAGARLCDTRVLEIALSDGSVAAIVADDDSAAAVSADGRRVNVYTLDEIRRLLEGFPTLAKVKLAYPGAEVVAVRRAIGDPLDAIPDSDLPIDDIPF